MKHIAIVAPKGAGGVETITNKLSRGLKLENYEVSLFRLNSTPYRTIAEDISLFTKLNNSDVVIYTGSISWVSQLIARTPLKALFIHGFVRSEWINEFLTSKNFRVRMGSLASLGWFEVFNKKVTGLDFYICHSLTTCEVNRIKTNYVILPQFIFPEEVLYYKKIALRYRERRSSIDEKTKEKVIVTYMSYAISPRLMSRDHLLKLATILASKLKTKTTLYIIDPRTSQIDLRLGNVTVRFIKPLRRELFYKLLASAALFIERCLDEEIGLSSIEAGLIGVPIAKITLPNYIRRQDYSNKELILGTSLSELAVGISEYINNINEYQELYVDEFRKFLLTKRSWDAVKRRLLILF